MRALRRRSLPTASCRCLLPSVLADDGARLYFIPDTVSSSAATLLPTILDRLAKNHNPSPLPRWSLEHRLMRSTVAPSSSSTSSSVPPAVRYLQLLTVSHLPGRSFVNVSPAQAQPTSQTGTVPAGNMVAIPAGPQTDEFSHFLTAKLAPLWTSRQTLLVQNGFGFEMEDYRVRIGEVKQAQAAQAPRGVVVEVEWLGDGDDGASGGETGEMAVQAFWDALELQGGRKYIKVPGAGGNGKAKSSDLARQYCELLRLRG